MRRLLVFLSLTIAILTLSGCGSKQESTKNDNSIPNPISDPGGYIPGMIDINKKAHEDVQNAIDSENKRLENALKNSGIEDTQK